MFEFSIAWKYLLPRRRQLSVSIISLISILVISLVIWLILVFFSVTRGLEKGWIDKLVTLTAPIRVTPTEAYYRSYYYQIDHVSQGSDYAFRSIREKLSANGLDPYDQNLDEELPSDFPKPDLQNGQLKDLVKGAFQAIESLPGLQAEPYEVTAANLRLRLVRGLTTPSETTQAFLSQQIYLGTLEESNPAYAHTILPVTEKDLRNALTWMSYGNQDEISDAPESMQKILSTQASKRQALFEAQLGTVSDTDKLKQINTRTYTSTEEPPFYALYRLKENQSTQYHLPYDPVAGYGVLAPKSFRDGGVLLGDRGFVSYYAPTASTLQEQRMPIFIAGFYDPGIVPLGGKFLLAKPELVQMIRAAQQQDATPMTNGINVRFTNLSDAEHYKKTLKAELDKRGLAPYWKVETFRDFDYAKDLLQQLSSEKNIFSLISGVIIIVACSNIISMLIILVNDKRLEIGILRAMGATSTSIAMIFGACGVAMGLMGSVIGTVLAFFTLRNLNELLHLISRLQGYDAFNPVFYGDQLPNSMNYETLATVIIVTTGISLLAGLIPAIKASRLKPAVILRSE